MTTAHKPTWNAARGSSTGQHDKGVYQIGVASAQFSSRDMPGQTTLKVRAGAQIIGNGTL